MRNMGTNGFGSRNGSNETAIETIFFFSLLHCATVEKTCFKESLVKFTICGIEKKFGAGIGTRDNRKELTTVVPNLK